MLLTGSILSFGVLTSAGIMDANAATPPIQKVQVNAQEVTGTVTDENGAPLPAST